jgi:hypothetical protein
MLSGFRDFGKKFPKFGHLRERIFFLQDILSCKPRLLADGEGEGLPSTSSIVFRQLLRFLEIGTLDNATDAC